ncbi:MAG: hypothetical protein SOZ89_03030 [Peptoniphilaceae bacterium]|nr:hypothetical protein [Peptoniphilaceae bacterium]MDY3738079.1 hypothetical protein [Peptoniphilaceae bacterium]
MKDRNGVDQFSVFLTWIGIIFVLISVFTKISFFSLIGLVIVIYGYFRVFSKNIIARNSENYVFLQKLWNPLTGKIKKFKRHTFGKNGYKYFYCPNCNQELKAPKGKGKIKIKCPKCGEKFEKRT